MYGIFGKPLKRAFQTCVCHWGYVASKKSYSAANVDRSGVFGQFSGISKARDTILTRFVSHFQVFGLEPT